MKKCLKFVIFILIIIILVLIFTKIVSSKNTKPDNIQNKPYTLTYVQDGKNELNKIIDKDNSNLYNYNIYTYCGDVSIEIDNFKYDFKDALEREIITIDRILSKASEDFENKICVQQQYLDGGSIQYTYYNYTILKYHDLNGKEDFVIGMNR